MLSYTCKQKNLKNLEVIKMMEMVKAVAIEVIKGFEEDGVEIK